MVCSKFGKKDETDLSFDEPHLSSERRLAPTASNKVCTNASTAGVCEAAALSTVVAGTLL